MLCRPQSRPAVVTDLMQYSQGAVAMTAAVRGTVCKHQLRVIRADKNKQTNKSCACQKVIGLPLMPPVHCAASQLRSLLLCMRHLRAILLSRCLCCHRLLPPLLLCCPRCTQHLANAAVPFPPVGVRAGGAAVPHRTAGAAWDWVQMKEGTVFGCWGGGWKAGASQYACSVQFL